MKAWLITVGEPLPTDNTADRLYRTGLVAEQLVAAGHEVLWWSSTVDHIRKRQRAERTTVAAVKPGLRLVLLRGMTYRRNVSFARLLNHMQIAREFRRLAPAQGPPDIILCSLPTLELARAATRYGETRGIPVVLDVRDLWPDIFVDVLPAFGRRWWRALLQPMFRMVQEACASAQAIIGITGGLVDWGLRYAGRAPGKWDRVFPMGYPAEAPSQSLQNVALERWRAVCPDDGHLNICYFGTIGRQFDLDTVIDAARQLESAGCPVRFVLCGDGESRERYQRLARDLRSVVFPGWVQRADIWALLRLCHVGLAPYRDSADFRASLPQKTIEYMSAGLPVISSLSGELEQLLHRHNCGITYRNRRPGTLADAVMRLAGDRQAREVMAKNARELYEREFRAESIYKELVAYLAEVSAARERVAAPG